MRIFAFLASLLATLQIFSVTNNAVFAQTASQASAANEDIAAIESDALSFDNTGKIAIASGDVKIVYQGKTLRADKVRWNQQTDEIMATGNVVLTETDGTIVYAAEATLRDEFKDGALKAIRMMMNDKSRMAASDGTRAGGTVTSLNKATYTACLPCKKNPAAPPVWQLKTSRTIFDETEETFFHEDARLEILGMPVLYLPFLSHPGPEVKKRSGFLTPNIKSSTDMGGDFSMPYFFNLAPNYDLTVTPRVTEKAGNLLGLNFRQLLENGQYSITANGVWLTEKENLDNDASFRGSLFMDGEFDLQDKWKLSFKAEEVTDETFLRRYEISSKNYLESNIALSKLDDRNFINLRAVRYNTTLAAIDEDNLPLLAPHLSTEHYKEDIFWQGDGRLTTDFMILRREEGTSVMRGIAEAGWHKKMTTESGQIISLFSALRGDVYKPDEVVNLTDGSFYDSDIRGQVTGHIGAMWQMPFVNYRQTSSHIIEPTVQVILAPNTSIDPRIPNEDSQSVEFDSTNLFSPTRFSGYDRFESGSRLDAGFRYIYENDNGREASIFVGKSERSRDNEFFAPGSGLESRQSDYILDLDIKPLDWMSAQSRMRLSQDNREVLRSETDFFASLGRVKASMGYVFLDRKLSSDDKERKEARARMSIRLTDNWRLDGNIRYDLFRETRVKNEIGLSYVNDCTYIRLGFNQSFTRDRNIGPRNGITLQINLRTLGGISTKSSVYEN